MAQYPNNNCDLEFTWFISKQYHQYLCNELITRPEESCQL